MIPATLDLNYWQMECEEAEEQGRVISMTTRECLGFITAARELETIKDAYQTSQIDLNRSNDALRSVNKTLIRQIIELETVKVELRELRNTPIIGKPKMHRFPRHDSMIYEVAFKMKHFLDAATIGEAFDAAREKSPNP